MNKEYLVNVERKIEYFAVATFKVEAIDVQDAVAMAKELAGSHEWSDATDIFSVPEKPEEIYRDKQKVFYQVGGIGKIHAGIIVATNIRNDNKVTYQVRTKAGTNREALPHEVFTSYWKVTGGPVGEAASDDCHAHLRTWQDAKEFLVRCIYRHHVPIIPLEDPTENENTSFILEGRNYCIYEETI